MDSAKNGQEDGSIDSAKTGDQEETGGSRKDSGGSEETSDNSESMKNKWVHNQELNPKPLRNLVVNLKEQIEKLLESKRAELRKFKDLEEKIKNG